MWSKKRKTFAWLLCLCVIMLVIRWGNSRWPPAHALELKNGQLADCPNTPNCVSTRATDPEQLIAPIPFSQSTEEAQQRLEKVIRSLPRSRVVTTRAGYVHAEFRSLLFGFVDDAEFAIDDSKRLIHIRSASRIGRSDLGVNRRRMEEVRKRFETR